MSMPFFDWPDPYHADIQVFKSTSNINNDSNFDTWLKPQGAKFIWMFVLGAGGGGGNGAATATGSTGGGGGAGGGGGWMILQVPAMFIPDYLRMGVGSGGSGRTLTNATQTLVIFPDDNTGTTHWITVQQGSNGTNGVAGGAGGGGLGGGFATPGGPMTKALFRVNLGLATGGNGGFTTQGLAPTNPADTVGGGSGGGGKPVSNIASGSTALVPQWGRYSTMAPTVGNAAGPGDTGGSGYNVWSNECRDILLFSMGGMGGGSATLGGVGGDGGAGGQGSGGGGGGAGVTAGGFGGDGGGGMIVIATF